MDYLICDVIESRCCTYIT